MIDFITKFFRREDASKNFAKERLRLVLMSDRVALAPDMFDAMKVEMLTVLRRYLEIDERSLDMHFENAERQFLLLANIPVLNVKTPEQIGAPRQTTPAYPSNGTRLESAANGASGSIDGEMPQKAQPARRRRRRRKRTGTNGVSHASDSGVELPPEPPAPPAQSPD